jgi:polyhydroxyalkanoate synthesis regulator phasin
MLQQLQQHTEELAASRSEAAELRGRVQALEGQLQEVLAALRQPPSQR